MEVALRLGVHGEGGRLAQVEHEVEVFGHLLRRAVEVDGARSVTHAHAVAVALAGVEVDLVAEVDGAFGAGLDAGIAAGAEVQIDGVAAVPFGVKRAEPALQAEQSPGKGGAAVGLRDGARAGQHGDVELVFQHRCGALGGGGVTQHQHSAARAVADGGHRFCRGQLRGGDERRDLRRGHFGVARPAAGFANVDEVDGPLLHAGGTLRLLVKFEEQAAFLRAGHQQFVARVAAVFGRTLERSGLASAQKRVLDFQAVRARAGGLVQRQAECFRIQRHAAVAVADQCLHWGRRVGNRSGEGRLGRWRR